MFEFTIDSIKNNLLRRGINMAVYPDTKMYVLNEEDIQKVNGVKQIADLNHAHFKELKRLINRIVSH